FTACTRPASLRRRSDPYLLSGPPVAPSRWYLHRRHPASVSFGVNVEARPQTVTEFWPKWQSEVINGVYPLRRLLNGSDHSAVFLTEAKAHDLANAAIKM